MSYSSQQYAAALFQSLEGKNPESRKAVLKQFLTMISRDHVQKKLPAILTEYEKMYVEKNKLRKVDIVSASPLSKHVTLEIEKMLGKKLLLTEQIDQTLIAGLTILVDDSVFIDASARTAINHLL